MTVPSLSARLQKADKDMLAEVLREAESRLDAQLTIALAADLRAMTFLGFMIAALAVVVGGTLAMIRSEEVDLFLSLVGLFGAAGLAFSCFYAFEAAKPIDFQVVGNDPLQWVEDAESGKPFHAAMSEVCEHYDHMLKANRVAMLEGSSNLLWAAKVAIATLFVGGFLIFVRLFHMVPA